MKRESAVRDGLVAGAVAGIVSGAPSTLHALMTRRGALDAVAAAGRLVLPAGAPKGARVVAGGLVHAALSCGWGITLAHVLPRGREAVAGAAAGVVIAAFDLGIVGRRVDEIRALPLVPQVADHLAFGIVAGLVISECRGRAAGTSAPRG